MMRSRTPRSSPPAARARERSRAQRRAGFKTAAEVLRRHSLGRHATQVHDALETGALGRERERPGPLPLAFDELSRAFTKTVDQIERNLTAVERTCEPVCTAEVSLNPGLLWPPSSRSGRITADAADSPTGGLENRREASPDETGRAGHQHLRSGCHTRGYSRRLRWRPPGSSVSGQTSYATHRRGGRRLLCCCSSRLSHLIREAAGTTPRGMVRQSRAHQDVCEGSNPMSVIRDNVLPQQPGYDPMGPVR